MSSLLHNFFFFFAVVDSPTKWCTIALFSEDRFYLKLEINNTDKIGSEFNSNIGRNLTDTAMRKPESISVKILAISVQSH